MQPFLDLPDGRGRERLALRPGAALRVFMYWLLVLGMSVGRLDRSEDRARQVLMAAPRHRCTANGCRWQTAAPVLPGSAEVGRSERPWCQLDQEWLGLALIQDSLRCLRVIQCRFPAGTGTRIEENSPSSNLGYICSLVANFSRDALVNWVDYRSGSNPPEAELFRVRSLQTHRSRSGSSIAESSSRVSFQEVVHRQVNAAQPSLLVRLHAALVLTHRSRHPLFSAAFPHMGPPNPYGSLSQETREGGRSPTVAGSGRTSPRIRPSRVGTGA